MMSKNQILGAVAMRYGLPEKLVIHVAKTGETITLINGMPAGALLETAAAFCLACGKSLPADRTKFCSELCGNRFRKSNYIKRTENRAQQPSLDFAKPFQDQNH